MSGDRRRTRFFPWVLRAPGVRPSDITQPEGDLLGAGDLEPLPGLDGGHELGGLEHGLVGPGVEPGDAAAEGDDFQLAFFEIEAVEVGDFQFAARRGFEVGRMVA